MNPPLSAPLLNMRVDRPAGQKHRRRQGQAHRHAGARSQGAGNVNLAAVQLNNPFDNRQTQALATLACGGCDALPALVKPVEQLRQVGCGNAWPGVFDGDQNLCAALNGIQ